jgi:L-phenylalanine/L-methionine N-acetyltransferase
MEASAPNLQIRAARPADAEAIVALQNLPGFRFGTLRMPHPGIDGVRRWLEGVGGDDRELLAFTGQELVGIAGLHCGIGRRRHVGSVGMGVHDDWTGRGIGRALLSELVDYADRWLGLRRLELSVYTDNAVAIGLYRKFGFVVEGTQRCCALRDGVLVDAYAMARLSGSAGDA